MGQREIPSDTGNARFIRTLGDYVYLGTDLGLAILKISKQPAILSSYRVVPSQLALVCNDATGMRLERSRSLVNAVWEDLRAVEPDEVVKVSMESGHAFFRLVKR